LRLLRRQQGGKLMLVLQLQQRAPNQSACSRQYYQYSRSEAMALLVDSTFQQGAQWHSTLDAQGVPCALACLPACLPDCLPACLPDCLPACLTV
jgi:hypothetical protein